MGRAAGVERGPPSRVAVAVRVTDGDAPDQAAIAASLYAELAHADMPVDEVAVTTAPLPVDPRHNSKIDYGKLRAQWRKRLGRRR